MTGYQAQCLVLALIFSAAFACFAVLAASSKRTWFVVVISLSSLFLAGIFATLTVLELSSERAEVVASLLPEVPFIFLLSAACLAPAGFLPARFGGVALESVARRPRLQTALGMAPLLLLLALTAAIVEGLIWPSHALRFYAAAPIQLLVTRALIMLPEAAYSALAGALFLIAAWNAPVWRLRTKNYAFSLGALCWATLAVNATVGAGVRVWAADGVRQRIVDLQLMLEADLAVISMVAFALGLTLRYVPGIAGPVLRRLYEGLLLSQDRFESLRWRLVTGGKVRGVIRASQYAADAADREGLSKIDIEKALTTIQLVAILQDTSIEANELTVEKARELRELQEEVLSNDILASKLTWMKDQRRADANVHGYHVESLPLYDALGAAIDLIDQPVDDDPLSERESSNAGRPLWYYLAAVSAAEAGLLDHKRVEDKAHVKGDRSAMQRARQAHETVKKTARGLTVRKI